MAAHKVDHEAAGGNDLEAPCACVVERRPDQTSADAFAFVGPWRFRMDEYQAIALLAIDGNGHAVLGAEFVAALGLIVTHFAHRTTAFT